MEHTIIIIVISVIIIVCVAAYYFSNNKRIKRKLKNSKLKKLIHFKSGDVAKLVGKVEFAGTPLRAPLSNRECAHYHIHVEQQVSSGKSSHWKTIINEEVSGNFVIRDGADYAFINDSRIKSYIVKDRKYNSGFLKDATERLEHYLNSKGFESENMLGFNKTIRYKEGVLEKDEEIAVFGKGQWVDAASVNLPDKCNRVLAIMSTPEEAVYLSDDPETTKDIAKKKANKFNEQHYNQTNSRYFKKVSDQKFYQK